MIIFHKQAGCNRTSGMGLEGLDHDLPGAGPTPPVLRESAFRVCAGQVHEMTQAATKRATPSKHPVGTEKRLSLLRQAGFSVCSASCVPVEKSPKAAALESST